MYVPGRSLFSVIDSDFLAVCVTARIASMAAYLKGTNTKGYWDPFARTPECVCVCVI